MKNRIREKSSQLKKSYFKFFEDGEKYINTLDLNDKDKLFLLNRLCVYLEKAEKESIKLSKKKVEDFIDMETALLEKTRGSIKNNLLENILIFSLAVLVINGILNLFRLGHFIIRPKGVFLVRPENIISPLITFLLLSIFLPIFTSGVKFIRKVLSFIAYIFIDTSLKGLLFGALEYKSINISEYREIPISKYLLISFLVLGFYVLLKNRKREKN